MNKYFVLILITKIHQYINNEMREIQFESKIDGIFFHLRVKLALN